MDIVRAQPADLDELVAAFARLMPQLALAPEAPPSREHVAAVLASPSTHLLVARDPEIVGTLTLTLFPVPQGLQGQINAVVVDQSVRGRGIGAALTAEAIRLARAAGAFRLGLTSNQARDTAHRLYERMGFVRAPSHVFRRKP